MFIRAQDFCMAMDDTGDSEAKVYCEECDRVFGSREQYERHRPHNAAAESCPLDSALSGIARLFRRARR